MKGVLGKILRWMSRELSPVLHNLLKPFSSPPGKMYVYGVISPIIVLCFGRMGHHSAMYTNF